MAHECPTPGPLPYFRFIRNTPSAAGTPAGWPRKEAGNNEASEATPRYSLASKTMTKRFTHLETKQRKAEVSVLWVRLVFVSHRFRKAASKAS